MTWEWTCTGAIPVIKYEVGSIDGISAPNCNNMDESNNDNEPLPICSVNGLGGMITTEPIHQSNREVMMSTTDMIMGDSWLKLNLILIM
jgi:hypothetical protein